MAKSNTNKSEGAAEAPLDNIHEVVETGTLTTVTDGLQVVISNQKKEIEELKELLEQAYEKVEAKDQLIKILQADLNTLAETPNSESLLAGVNPLGKIEDHEEGAVYVASNGNCYGWSNKCPERFNFLGINKTKEEWIQDIDAMHALVTGRSPFIKLLN